MVCVCGVFVVCVVCVVSVSVVITGTENEST